MVHVEPPAPAWPPPVAGGWPGTIPWMHQDSPLSAQPARAGQDEAARLEPPRTARRLIPREALLQRLLEARRQRCVAVRGPAGCGREPPREVQ